MSASVTEPEVAVSAKNKLLKLNHKRLERFVTLFPKVLVSDDPDTIHDLRVWSRRLQQTFRVIVPKPAPPKARKLIRTLRKVRQAFSACRNLDVSTDLIQQRHHNTGAAIIRQSWQMVREELEAQRRAEILQARQRIARHDIVAFVDRAQALIKSADVESESIEKLQETVWESLKDWDDAFAVAREKRDVDNLHALRIATKRLRYRAELLADLGKSALKSPVKALKEFQTLIGDWHDRYILLEHVAEFISRRNFLVNHPDIGRSLLAEMEKEKLRNDSITEEILSKAPKVRDCWNRLKPALKNKIQNLNAQ
jgi:CHAD domain-containing protein